ncbi:hypothetical protein DACRYDRAFT_20115 [Dacryopinax primogenitus]|uniref:Uncharacterized protein n=1 Tax=Dacryopinax primogenitus (strain DJM 731) TaxID=1858805 RepID=M5GBF6_DACPD|nr:uncharacterized protein DACRYDRAFT_20115 [Dacryopinax primogenitus]EJU05715.1 hypothetical protein DACRYDRAFT_20115 [Dacryopinax primogenitus]
MEDSEKDRHRTSIEPRSIESAEKWVADALDRGVDVELILAVLEKHKGSTSSSTQPRLTNAMAKRPASALDESGDRVVPSTSEVRMPVYDRAQKRRRPGGSLSAKSGARTDMVVSPDANSPSPRENTLIAAEPASAHVDDRIASLCISDYDAAMQRTLNDAKSEMRLHMYKSTPFPLDKAAIADMIKSAVRKANELAITRGGPTMELAGNASCGIYKLVAGCFRSGLWPDQDEGKKISQDPLL